jgi:hypothetical protein
MKRHLNPTTEIIWDDTKEKMNMAAGRLSWLSYNTSSEVTVDWTFYRWYEIECRVEGLNCTQLGD